MLRIDLIFIIGLPLCSSCCCSQSNRNVNAANHCFSPDAVRVLDTISSVDDLNQTVDVMNSRISVHTTAIDQLASEGLSVIADIVAVMESEETSFDTFVRCYAACDMILEREDASMRVGWGGGCRIVTTVSGVARLYPNGQADERLFRRTIVNELNRNVRWLLNRRAHRSTAKAEGYSGRQLARSAEPRARRD